MHYQWDNMHYQWDKIIDTANTSSTRGCPSWNFILREVRKRGFTCSRPTVVYFLKDAGIIQRSFSKGLFLTESHKAKRLTFALKMQKWSVAQLRHIIWCDEKKFTCQLGQESRSYICRASDPPKPPLKASHKWFGGDGVNVWMGISFIYGIFYHVFPNRDSNGKITITSDVFKCAMTKRGGFLSFLKRHSGARVAMDNAPCHNGSFRTFKENEVVVLDFPPKSPDRAIKHIQIVWIANERRTKRSQRLCSAHLSGIFGVKSETLNTWVDFLCEHNHVYAQLKEEGKINVVTEQHCRDVVSHLWDRSVSQEGENAINSMVTQAVASDTSHRDPRGEITRAFVTDHCPVSNAPAGAQITHAVAMQLKQKEGLLNEYVDMETSCSEHFRR